MTEGPVGRSRITDNLSGRTKLYFGLHPEPRSPPTYLHPRTEGLFVTAIVGRGRRGPQGPLSLNGLQHRTPVRRKESLRQLGPLPHKPLRDQGPEQVQRVGRLELRVLRGDFFARPILERGAGD